LPRSAVKATTMAACSNTSPAATAPAATTTGAHRGSWPSARARNARSPPTKTNNSALARPNRIA
jgi:hypothetical protein